MYYKTIRNIGYRFMLCILKKKHTIIDGSYFPRTTAGRVQCPGRLTRRSRNTLRRTKFTSFSCMMDQIDCDEAPSILRKSCIWDRTDDERLDRKEPFLPKKSCFQTNCMKRKTPSPWNHADTSTEFNILESILFSPVPHSQG